MSPRWRELSEKSLELLPSWRRFRPITMPLPSHVRWLRVRSPSFPAARGSSGRAQPNRHAIVARTWVAQPGRACHLCDNSVAGTPQEPRPGRVLGIESSDLMQRVRGHRRVTDRTCHAVRRRSAAVGRLDGRIRRRMRRICRARRSPGKKRTFCRQEAHIRRRRRNDAGRSCRAPASSARCALQAPSRLKTQFRHSERLIPRPRALPAAGRICRLLPALPDQNTLSMIDRSRF